MFKSNGIHAVQNEMLNMAQIHSNALKLLICLSADVLKLKFIIGRNEREKYT